MNPFNEDRSKPNHARRVVIEHWVKNADGVMACCGAQVLTRDSESVLADLLPGHERRLREATDEDEGPL